MICFIPVSDHTYFNPRSHEGSDYSASQKGHSSCDFNPRSHEGSDIKYAQGELEDLISIHAPTRGATLNVPVSVYLITISIHAPTRGATPRLLLRSDLKGDFNPRSHEGSDWITIKATER